MTQNTENLPLVQISQPNQKGHNEPKTKSTITPLQPSLPNSEKRAIKRLGKYQFSIDQKIGSGMTGDVYVGMNVQTYELVCVKVVDREVFKTSDQLLLLDNEIRCQKACNSGYTVKLFDTFDTSSFRFIITEFCEGGDLYRCLRGTTNGLPEPVVVQFAREIALALKQLKDANIIHRDIKSENVLIQKNGCKLGDFGFAIQKDKLSCEKKFNLGSPLYMSIESLQSSVYSFASDIFSFGVVLYEMLHRESPWECSDEKELLQKMKCEQVSFKSGILSQMKTLINRCLSREPQDRPTIQEILNCPLFKNTAKEEQPTTLQNYNHDTTRHM